MGKIIFIDESNFYTKNVNYKTWRKSSEQIFNNFKDNDKRNLILAVSNEKIIFWTINSENKNFMEKVEDEVIKILEN